MKLKLKLRHLTQAVLPQPMQDRLRRVRQHLLRRSPVGWANFGNLRRLLPFSRVFGQDRGRCIDRHYIEAFLYRHRADIKGHTLEIGDDTYTVRFGGAKVTRGEVLHVSGGVGQTLVADLTRADHLPSDLFDCIIFTQTLQFIYDTRAAVGTLHRILRPGGVVLATVPGISQISRFDMDHWGEYWRFTRLSMSQRFAEFFPPDQVEVRADGNVLSSISFLLGLAAEELSSAELSHVDPAYELLISVRAVKGHGVKGPAGSRPQ